MPSYTIKLPHIGAPDEETYAPTLGADGDVGVTWSREKHNETPEVDEDTDEEITYATNEEYLQFVFENWYVSQESVDANLVQETLTRAAASYLKQQAAEE